MPVCPDCGHDNPVDARFCTSCGATLSVPVRRERVEVDTWLVPAILTTVLCCLPFGVIGIVFASQAASKRDAGDAAGARAAAAKARLWTLVGLGSGLAFILLVGLLALLPLLLGDVDVSRRVR